MIYPDAGRIKVNCYMTQKHGKFADVPGFVCG